MAFAAYLDYINETPLANLFSYQSINIVKKSEVEVNADNAIELFGWCAADGGIADYVWSADGGLTWNQLPQLPRVEVVEWYSEVIDFEYVEDCNSYYLTVKAHNSDCRFQIQFWSKDLINWELN